MTNRLFGHKLFKLLDAAVDNAPAKSQTYQDSLYDLDVFNVQTKVGRLFVPARKSEGKGSTRS